MFVVWLTRRRESSRRFPQPGEQHRDGAKVHAVAPRSGARRSPLGTALGAARSRQPSPTHGPNGPKNVGVVSMQSSTGSPVVTVVPSVSRSFV